MQDAFAAAFAQWEETGMPSNPRAWLVCNTLLPARVSKCCAERGIPWGHVSSGCIYTGSLPNGEGFRETDAPNFCFRTNNCSFYSGSKALAEELLLGSPNTYVWRLRIPFNHVDSETNYLSKILRYKMLLEARNSISHLNEFVEACLQSWLRRIPFGIYNVTNSGSITTKEVVTQLKKHLKIEKDFQFFENEEQFMKLAAKTPRSSCVIDNSKLSATGIPMSDVHTAIEKALTAWIPKSTI